MKNIKFKTIVLTVLALFVGIFVFSLSEYRSATLNIDATSMEKGVGTVFVEKAGFLGSARRTFDINEYQGDEGVKKLYVIELPATRLESLRIVPQISRGNWGVDRIILANDTLRYIWDEQGVCIREMQIQGGHKNEPCRDGGPFIAASADSSVTISAIPEAGFKNTPETRYAMALVFACGILFGGAWLLRPVAEKTWSAVLVRYGVRISWLTITILFVWQLYLISRYSVDVPKLDEWITYFQSDGLVKGLTLQWLFSFHNEHLIVFTKLLAWLNLKFFGLNFVIQNIVNYFIFGGLLASMALYKNRLLGEEKFALFPFFLIFMLSPINYENHLWAFQSQFHLPLLFSVLMLCHAYRSDLSTGSAAAFSVYGLLASYAFSAGVIFVAVYLLCTTVYVVAVMAGERVDRACGMRYLLTTCGLCGMSLCLWFFCYELAGDPHPKVFPYELKFWSFYLSVISFGFGFESEQIVLGIVCLVLAALPPLLLLVRKETRWQATSWHVLTAVLGILAVLAAISVGRAWIYPAKTSRYAEIGFLLIPYTALGWWLVMKEGFRRTAMLSFLWLFCFVAYLDDWSTKGHALFKQISLYNLRYIGAYYAGGSDIHPESATAEDMDRARSLGVRFTRQFTARKAGGE